MYQKAFQLLGLKLGNSLYHEYQSSNPGHFPDHPNQNQFTKNHFYRESNLGLPHLMPTVQTVESWRSLIPFINGEGKHDYETCLLKKVYKP